MKTKVISSTRRTTMLGMGLLVTAVMTAATLLPVIATPSATAATVNNGLISFTSDRDNKKKIYTMDKDGSGVTPPLTTRWSQESKWSPDGSQLVYAGVVYFNNQLEVDVFRINANGTDETNMTPTPNPGRQNRTPAWSPNGSEIAFTSNGTDNLGNNNNNVQNFNVWVMNALDYTEKREVTGIADQSEEREPSWSPTESEITYASNENGNWNIYRMNSRFGLPVMAGLTTSNDVDDRKPAWSPDGENIAFARKHNGDTDIWTMDAYDGEANSQSVRNLTDDPAEANTKQTDPAWSPDGTKIAYASNEDGKWQIYVMNSNGTGKHKVSRDGNVNDTEPSWQPIIVPDPPTPNPPQPTPQQVPLATPSYSEPCAVEITTPRLKKTTKWKSKKSRKTTTVKVSRKAMKSILAGHGIKGLVVDGRVNGKLVKCTGLRALLLKKSGSRYLLPGTGTKVSSKRLSPTRFKKTASWLKRKYRGAIRLRTKRTNNGTKFSYKPYNRRSRAGRKALNRLKKRNYRGTYAVFYTAKVNGKTIQREIVLKTGKSK